MRRLDVVKQYGFHYLRTTFKNRSILIITNESFHFFLIFSPKMLFRIRIWGFENIQSENIPMILPRVFFFKDATKVSSFTEQLIRRYTCTRVLVVETRARDRN